MNILNVAFGEQRCSFLWIIFLHKEFLMDILCFAIFHQIVLRSITIYTPINSV